MKVDIEQLRRDVRAVLAHHGVPDEEAEVGAEMCLDAELRGHGSHGVRLLRNVVAQYRHTAERRSEPKVVHETPVSARFDGGFHLSWFAHRSAVDIAIAKAERSGIAIVSAAGAGVSGALSYLAERMAGAGLVGIAINSSPVTVVAPGTSVPSLGTNPLAIAVPRRSRPPLVLDMATSSIAFNQILRARDLGQELPAGVATDGSGNATRDPAAAIDPVSGRGRILPFGGHRGFGLALMLELMVSAGVTGRTGEDKRGPFVQEPADFSGFYLAYHPDLVGDPAAGAVATERLLSELTGEGVRLPGEVARVRRDRCYDEGVVELDYDVLEMLRELTNA
ncbi:Ldh family oxidoreductase [Amycolatopsis pigmentata]|uniref:Ldh family oxidoreductase n=1 Tax=Amycolatopsis pigmentata TaxID=450801 RepID=A0ABW5FQK6_9PSEU